MKWRTICGSLRPGRPVRSLPFEPAETSPKRWGVDKVDAAPTRRILLEDQLFFDLQTAVAGDRLTTGRRRPIFDGASCSPLGSNRSRQHLLQLSFEPVHVLGCHHLGCCDQENVRQL